MAVAPAFPRSTSSIGSTLAAKSSISEAIAGSTASAPAAGPAGVAFSITASAATVDPSALSAEVIIVANTFRAVVEVDRLGS